MKTIDAFDRQFPSEESCKQFLADMRWPQGVRCPRCNSEKVYALKARPFHWLCKSKECGGRNGYRFSVITHTIFQDTKIPLKLWFKVGYLMLVSKKGISALQIHRVIFGEDSGSDYHTSWYMCHRWRAAMKGDALKLTGEVEVDETYIGGKEQNKHKSKRLNARGGSVGKIPVIGAIARKGMVVAKVLERVSHVDMEQFVHETVKDDVSLVATDEAGGYRLLKRQGYPHETVGHYKGEYVRGNVHTANLDSFWSLLKRGIMGSYHKVSKDYLPLYVNEFSWRFNNRKNPNAFADLLTTCSH
ncbi:MAG: IS1595 family transposase [Deltaproteobacteria bacterium]|nr:IS1595 family transposase [Deltaproteobacteria bacterium]